MSRASKRGRPRSCPRLAARPDICDRARGPGPGPGPGDGRRAGRMAPTSARTCAADVDPPPIYPPPPPPPPPPAAARRMRELRPPYARTAANGDEHCFCAACDAYRPRAAFYATALAKRARTCKTCWRKQQRVRRAASAVDRMLHSVRNRLRARGHRELARAWERSDVVDVLRRHGRSAPPYFRRDGHLTLVRADPAVPLYPHNARPVPTRDVRQRPKRAVVVVDGDGAVN